MNITIAIQIARAHRSRITRKSSRSCVGITSGARRNARAPQKTHCVVCLCGEHHHHHITSEQNRVRVRVCGRRVCVNEANIWVGVCLSSQFVRCSCVAGLSHGPHRWIRFTKNINPNTPTHTHAFYLQVPLRIFVSTLSENEGELFYREICISCRVIRDECVRFVR